MADRIDKRDRLVFQLVVAMLWIGRLLGVALSTPRGINIYYRRMFDWSADRRYWSVSGLSPRNSRCD